MVSVERNQELQRQAEQYLLGHSEDEELTAQEAGGRASTRIGSVVRPYRDWRR
jgi:hypothetical protein